MQTSKNCFKKFFEITKKNQKYEKKNIVTNNHFIIKET